MIVKYESMRDTLFYLEYWLCSVIRIVSYLLVYNINTALSDVNIYFIISPCQVVLGSRQGNRIRKSVDANNFEGVE